jgi:hypothetical protein
VNTVRDLAHVLGHGVGVLDEVEPGPGVQRVVLAAHALGDVAQRQKAHALVLLAARDQRVVAVHRVDQRRCLCMAPLGLPVVPEV